MRKMVENENETIQEEEEAGGEKAAGSKPLLKWAIIAVVVLVLVGGGVFIGSKMQLLPSTESKNDTAATKKEKEIGKMWPMETFIVNLAGGKGRRYLKVRMNLELDHEKLELEVQQKVAQIRDSILILLSSKSFTQIESMEGKNTLREEILVRVNGLVTSGKVRGVYFTEFVVQ